MRGGLTLIEVMLVVLILAIVAMAVGVNLRGPMRRARLADLIEDVASFDWLTRVHAREHDKPLRLVVDLSAGRIWRTDADGGEQLGEAVSLPPGCRIARLIVAQQDITIGSASINCSRLGLTPTYAVRLEGREGVSQWLLFAGLTGEVSRLEDERYVQDILASLRPGHHVD